MEMYYHYGSVKNDLKTQLPRGMDDRTLKAFLWNTLLSHVDGFDSGYYLSKYARKKVLKEVERKIREGL
jgi:hypothetical protein